MIWWPKIGADIENHVTSYAICVHWYPTPIKPMIPSQLLELPWQNVATELFELDGKYYIVVTDYFSCYFKLVELRSETADSVINVLKAIFARHSVPAVCFSDYGTYVSVDSVLSLLKVMSSGMTLAACISHNQMERLNAPKRRPRICCTSHQIHILAY